MKEYRIKTLRTQVLATALLLAVAVAAFWPPASIAVRSTATNRLSIDSHPSRSHSHADSVVDFSKGPLDSYGQLVTDQRPGGTAVAHYEGGVPHPGQGLAKKAPHAQILPTGIQAAEPTLGIDEDGTMFFVGTDGPHIETPFGLAPTRIEWPVMRSDDGGKTWTDVSPMLGPQRAHALVGLDPMLHVDRDTGRVFTVDFQVPGCHTASFSDDKGATWITSPACGITDHQTVFTGPPVSSPTIGYPNIVYDCAMDGGMLAGFSTMTSCLKSLDGGITWVRTGNPAYADHLNPESGPLMDGNCGGATGHGITDDEGTIYLPRGWCEEPYLAISHDEGLTWDRVLVADGERYRMPAGEHEAGVAADSQGNLYYVWTGKDRLFYLATSEDGGATWSEPKMIAAPGVTETWGPTIDVGAPGKIAVAYIGSTNAPGGMGADGTGREYDNVSWDGYITMTDEALDKKPLFFSGTVNHPDDPLTAGRGCGTLRCDSRIYDFLDIVISPDGIPYTSMVASQSADGVFTPTWGTGFVGALVGGPSLVEDDAKRSGPR